MNTSKKLLLRITLVMSFSTLCHSQDFASDFEQALVTLRERAGSRRQSLYYYDMKDAVHGFVAKHRGTSVVEFLEAKIEESDSRRLALLSLAKLAVTDKNAEDALYRQIYGKGSTSQRDTIVAIAYIDPDKGRPIIETVVNRPGHWRLRRAAVEMLVGLGDQKTLEMLQQLRRVEENSYVKTTLESAIPQLEHRLTKVPAGKRAEWARNEILLWRTVQESPHTRKVYSENGAAAETLHAQGWRFSREYLEHKVGAADLTAIAITGHQKETWAVQSLNKYAKLRDARGEFSRNALAAIRTDEALRVLEQSLDPRGFVVANRHILWLLRHSGDETSAEFLKRLSLNKRFPERERALMNTACRYIKRRLSGSGKRSSGTR